MRILAIIPILFAVSFIIFVFVLIFSPKLMGKFARSRIKATKYMVEESKDDLKDISTNMAEATKDGIKITTGAIREGFTGDTIFCKHCGSSIEKDSKFCKNCGKDQ